MTREYSATGYIYIYAFAGILTLPCGVFLEVAVIWGFYAITNAVQCMHCFIGIILPYLELFYLYIYIYYFLYFLLLLFYL